MACIRYCFLSISFLVQLVTVYAVFQQIFVKKIFVCCLINCFSFVQYSTTRFGGEANFHISIGSRPLHLERQPCLYILLIGTLTETVFNCTSKSSMSESLYKLFKLIFRLKLMNFYRNLLTMFTFIMKLYVQFIGKT